MAPTIASGISTTISAMIAATLVTLTVLQPSPRQAARNHHASAWENPS
jgi:hypothetical protein